MRIVSEDSLIIETYADRIELDAELLIWPWWPNYGQGPGAWHSLTAGIRAEAAEELAFSWAKADQLGIDWMSFLPGPGSSLDVLEGWMDQSADEGYIPYAPTLGDYVSLVHPHVCGDSRVLALALGFVFGFTPTYVGTAYSTPVGCATLPVHPHVCGDSRVTGATPHTSNGSPPRMWGQPVVGH